MKAQVMDMPSNVFGSTARNVVSSMKLTSCIDGRVSKSRSREVDAEEIQACLHKLKDLVPNMPRNKKVSKLEIIQSVIDYITDLQFALDTPASVPRQSSVNSNRQPLGTIPATPNTILNVLDSHFERSPDSRTVSC